MGPNAHLYACLHGNLLVETHTRQGGGAKKLQIAGRARLENHPHLVGTFIVKGPRAGRQEKEVKYNKQT